MMAFKGSECDRFYDDPVEAMDEDRGYMYEHDSENESDSERQEIEFALYSQIHYQDYQPEDATASASDNASSHIKNSPYSELVDRIFDHVNIISNTSQLITGGDLRCIPENNNCHINEKTGKKLQKPLKKAKQSIKHLTKMKCENESESSSSKYSIGQLKHRPGRKQMVSPLGYDMKHKESTRDRKKSTTKATKQNEEEGDNPDVIVIGSSKSELSEADSFIEDLSSDSESTEKARTLNKTIYDIHLNVDNYASSDQDSDREVVDPEKWSINDQDRFGVTSHKTSSSPRYRYYIPLNVQCHNCKERGHLSKACPKPQKHLICYLCGQTGHNFRACPQSICFNCDLPVGHSAKECPNPRRRLYDECRRCYMLGHIQFDCPDLWRQYHMTTTNGKLVKLKEKRNSKVYCHNCGDRGHFGFECEEEPVNRHSPASYPFIARYEQPHRMKRAREENGYCGDFQEPTKKKSRMDGRQERSNSTTLSTFAENTVRRQIIVGSKHTNKTKGNKVKNRKKNKQEQNNSHEVDNTNSWKAKGVTRKQKKKKARKNRKNGTDAAVHLNDVNKDTVKSVATSRRETPNKGKNSRKTAAGKAQKKKISFTGKDDSKTYRTVHKSKRGFTISLPCRP